MSISAAANTLHMTGPASERLASRSTMKVFWACTALVWGGVGVCAALFFVGILDFTTSAKIGLYAISIWLNVWMLVFLLPQNKGRPKLDLYHDALVVWMLSYMLTNALWEIPWVLFSPFVFENLHSFSELFAGFENMSGGVADTLLALVWTQYQYFLFPLIFGYFGVKLLMEDWRQCNGLGDRTEP